MAGTFSKSSRPKRPGAYFRFVAKQPEPVFVNPAGVVAVAITHSWGPGESVVELNSFSDFLKYFGRGTADGSYTPGYIAVHDLFRGEGVDGRGGAGQVLAFRMEGSSAAKANKALSNGTVPAITLTALYTGSYGNQLGVQVVADALDATNYHNLVLYLEGQEVERYRYAKANITDLAAQINGTTPYSADQKSDWVSAGSVTSGTALTLVGTTTAFTTGDDGSTILGADYDAFQTAVEPFRFGLLTAQNLTDATILADFKAWAQNLNTRGKRFMSVFGGAAAETITTATGASTGSALFNDPDFMRVGVGTVHDDLFGDLSTAQLAPRIAGILAQRGEALSITFARLSGVEIKVGAAESDILTALDNGVTVISRDSHPTAPVRIEKGLTTYTTKSDVTKPFSIYSVPKFVRSMHSIENDLTTFAESNVIGRLPVNDATRDFVRGQMAAQMATREAAGIIQPGWTVAISSEPAPSETDDFVSLDYSILFGRSLEQVLDTVTIG